MVSEVLTIRTVEDKIGFQTKKPYTRVNDRFNLFESELIQWFTQNKGKTVRVDIEKTGKYENVRQIGEVLGDNVAVPTTTTSQTKIVQQEAPMKQSSRVFGKGDDQVKIYFDTAKDLDEQIRDLRNRDLMPKAYFEAYEAAKDMGADVKLLEEFDTEPQQVLG